MGLFDIFKTQWSGKDMTDDDRKKIFWYLKRKTSYTAWKREADAFDKFADLFEKQVIEEPHADGLMEGTDWPRFYPEILKAQVLYEQALKQLLNGDRTIFLYNSLGLLRDASDIAQSWHREIVNNGPQGDHFYDGKYVEEMKAALEEFFRVSYDTGYLEPGMAGGSAPELWSTIWRDDFAKMPIPKSLPDVPIPKTEVLIRSGEAVPVFGIYEPQTKDGCMNYLLAGVLPAPTLHGSDGTYMTEAKLSVTWRLIWEEDRYLNGSIPTEESDYFPPEIKPAQPISVVSDDILSATSGMLCQKTGMWAVLDDINGRLSVKKGDPMPQHNGRDVTWVWIAA